MSTAGAAQPADTPWLNCTDRLVTGATLLTISAVDDLRVFGADLTVWAIGIGLGILLSAAIVHPRWPWPKTST